MLPKIPGARFASSNHPMCLFIIDSNSLTLKLCVKFSEQYPKASFYTYVKINMVEHIIANIMTQKSRLESQSGSSMGSIKANTILASKNPKNGN